MADENTAPESTPESAPAPPPPDPAPPPPAPDSGASAKELQLSEQRGLVVATVSFVAVEDASPGGPPPSPPPEAPAEPPAVEFSGGDSTEE